MEHWLVLHSGACDCAFNMALDEALMEGAAAVGQPMLRFYGWQQPAASFGYFQRVADIEAATHLRPLLRRPTGGGLVPHDRDWTYSVTIPPSHHWYHLPARESYQRVHSWLHDAFHELGVPTGLALECRRDIPGQCFAGYEQHDLLWLGRKIAGAAQRRTKEGLLIQGSVQPQPPNVSRANWERALVSVAQHQWGAVFDATEPPAAISKRANELCTQKYSRAEYNRKR